MEFTRSWETGTFGMEELQVCCRKIKLKYVIKIYENVLNKVKVSILGSRSRSLTHLQSLIFNFTNHQQVALIADSDKIVNQHSSCT